MNKIIAVLDKIRQLPIDRKLELDNIKYCMYEGIIPVGEALTLLHKINERERP